MKKEQRHIFKSAKKDPQAPKKVAEKKGEPTEKETKPVDKQKVKQEDKEEETKTAPRSVRTPAEPKAKRQRTPLKKSGTIAQKKKADAEIPESKPKKPVKRKPSKPASNTKTGKVERKVEDALRLNRYISNAGVCSRRKADELIEQGKIKVNGKVVTELGTKVTMKDTIEYDGRRLDIKDLVYILLNKPKNTITTMRDPKKRKTVMDLIDKRYQGIFPVGRLDRNTTGVLLITNDGEMAHRLTHPRRNVKKIYRVKLTEAVTKEHLLKLVEGVELEDGPMQADKAVFVEDDQSVVGVEVHSGKNRIVRRMFEHLGYQVKQLERVIFAGLDKRKLRPGEWRELTPKELKHLRIQAGLNGGK